MANHNRTKNYIHKIVNSDGSIIDSEELICNYGVEHFKNSFNDHFTNIPLTNPHVIPQIINDSDNEMLCLLPSDVEIYNAVMDLNGDSIAGPDGYTTNVFQNCWEIVKTDIIEAVIDFFKGSTYPKFFTSTSIILIPKIVGAIKWNDFRPISLCSFFNKLISKIISKRLESILPRIISSNQTGFVKGRTIFNNVLLTQELAHDINTKVKGSNIILKLDISKAYDNLNWNFLYKVLSLFGFSNFFIKLIQNSIDNCYFSVMINGRNHGFFKSCKKRSHLFEDIFTCFQKKLTHWPSNFLSYGGRLILIKSVLNSIPIYLLHSLHPTAAICLRIERMLNKFF
ncbi:integrator complex subunit 11 [Dendrobium catenatum]|uniref:Integrator complex subunit 11 n=1 Tax=Dendrobium catenatum TaxID=906689 RepID=A0A2I0VU07_9ASPA|nr:integrator complex subunit 11 [Dendrobium catenatum]